MILIFIGYTYFSLEGLHSQLGELLLCRNPRLQLTQPGMLTFSARRAVIVSKPQASAWGEAKHPVASERRFVRAFGSAT